MTNNSSPAAVTAEVILKRRTASMSGSSGAGPGGEQPSAPSTPLSPSRAGGAAKSAAQQAVEEEVSKALAGRLEQSQTENYSLKQKVTHLEHAIRLSNDEIANKKLMLRLLVAKIPAPATGAGALTTDEHLKLLAKNAKLVRHSHPPRFTPFAFDLLAARVFVCVWCGVCRCAVRR